MKTIQGLMAFSTTSQYGTDVDNEIAADVVLACTTPIRSIPYLRAYGTKAKLSESKPLTILSELDLQIQVIQSVQFYNDNIVSQYERRAAVTTDSIEFDESGKNAGMLGMSIRYMPMNKIPQTYQVRT